MRALTMWREDGRALLQCVVIMGNLRQLQPYLLVGADPVPEEERDDPKKWGVEVPQEMSGEQEALTKHPLMDVPMQVKVKVRSVLVGIHEAEGVPAIAIYRQVAGEIEEGGRIIPINAAYNPGGLGPRRLPPGDGGKLK